MLRNTAFGGRAALVADFTSTIGSRTPVMRSVKSRSSSAAYFTDGDASAARTIAYSGARPRTASSSVPAQPPRTSAATARRRRDMRPET